jgi:hypothetical protein
VFFMRMNNSSRAMPAKPQARPPGGKQVPRPTYPGRPVGRVAEQAARRGEHDLVRRVEHGVEPGFTAAHGLHNRRDVRSGSRKVSSHSREARFGQLTLLTRSREA